MSNGEKELNSSGTCRSCREKHGIPLSLSDDKSINIEGARLIKLESKWLLLHSHTQLNWVHVLTNLQTFTAMKYGANECV